MRRCAARRRAGASPTSRSPSEALVRALESARFAPSGGNRQGWRVVVVARRRATRAALRDLYLPALARLHGADGRRAMLADPDALRRRAACGWCGAPTNTPSSLDEVPVHLVIGVRLADLAVTDAGAAAPEHRRRRVGLPVRAEPAAGAARRGSRRGDDDAARARRGRGQAAARIPDEIALAAHIGVGHRADPWPEAARAPPGRGVRLRRALRRAARLSAAASRVRRARASRRRALASLRSGRDRAAS